MTIEESREEIVHKDVCVYMFPISPTVCQVLRYLDKKGICKSAVDLLDMEL